MRIINFAPFNSHTNDMFAVDKILKVIIILTIHTTNHGKLSLNIVLQFYGMLLLNLTVGWSRLTKLN